MNAAVCRDVAFDTVIMVKQTPRRMLAAVQEVCGGSVLVPDETAREAAKVYVRVAAGQARRETPAFPGIARVQGTRPPRGGYAASMAFSRCSHSSSSTISKRTILPRMAGTNSAQSVFFACREQRSNTERL